MVQIHTLLPTLDHFVGPIEVEVAIPVPGEISGVVWRQTEILLILLLSVILAMNLEMVSDMEVS